jgi:hypothetical protein
MQPQFLQRPLVFNETRLRSDAQTGKVKSGQKLIVRHDLPAQPAMIPKRPSGTCLLNLEKLGNPVVTRAAERKHRTGSSA